MSNKKQEQLKMNPSTAQHRLLKDILWKLIVETNQDICCKCNELMTRENFSIEHIVPWLDSENPVELFFDLENISFSHLSCNISTSRRTISDCGTTSSYRRGCRCSSCKEIKKIADSKRVYNSEKRKETYKRLNK